LSDPQFSLNPPRTTMSKQIAITHALILPMDDAHSMIVDGAVVIDGDRIVDVGPSEQVMARLSAPVQHVVNATGKALMPGFVDLHYHTALAKGWNDNLPLKDWLDACWYPMVRTLDHEAAYWAAMLSYSDSIRCGVTTVNDMYRHVEALADAAVQLGIRAVLANDVADPEFGLDTLDDARRLLESKHGIANGRIQIRVGVEWLPVGSIGLLKGVRKLADEFGAGIHIHLNESLTEIELAQKRLGGLRPLEAAYETGVLGDDCVAAHCIWLTDREVEMLAETGTHVSHNPVANAKLGNGVARVGDLIDAGINVGLGHDCAECNNSRDMFQNMKFASLLQRAIHTDPQLMQPAQVLHMATRAGALALKHPTGEIAVGKKADLILIDLNSHMFTPLIPGNRDHLYSHLVFSAQSGCVDSTMVDGRFIMENRRLSTVDESEILAQANRHFQKISARIERGRERRG
jgi:5-methylthioadenosine/S-adenosylhomocysteine deaminase